MKALLFTLLLLFIVISPSLTAPPTLTAPSGQSTVYRNRQRIIYSFFTTFGIFNIELLYDPRLQALVRGPFRNMEFRPGQGFTQVVIDRRRVVRWDLIADPPTSTLVWIEATINFTPPNYLGGVVPGYGVEFGHNVLGPGVSIIDPRTVYFSHISQVAGEGQQGWRRPANEYPQTGFLILMTILAPNAIILDPVTQHTIQAGILRTSIQPIVRPFLQPGAGSPWIQYYQLPLQLDPIIWNHLLTNRMPEYNLNDIPGAPPSKPPPRPHPNEGCSGTSSRQRNKDDQDDPEAEREGKRICHAFDLNEIPGDKGKGKAVDQGDQQVPVRTARTGRFSAFLNGLRTIGRYAKQAIQSLGRERYSPRPLTSAQKKNKEVIDVLKMARFSYGGQYGLPSFH
jgi:hypothetical protein